MENIVFIENYIIKGYIIRSDNVYAGNLHERIFIYK